MERQGRPLASYPRYGAARLSDGHDRRPGPVHLLIPEDILNEIGDIDSVKLYSPEQYRVSATTKPAANEESIKKAAEMLVNANLVSIHVGNGGERAEAGREVLELAEYLGMPITKTARGMSVTPCGHPLAVSSLSLGGVVAHIQADLLLVVGTRLGEMAAFGKPPVWGDPAAAKTVQIDIEPTNIGLNRPVDLGLVGDAKVVLRQLIEAVKVLTGPREPHAKIAEFKGYEAEWRADLDKRADEFQNPLNVGSVVRECNRFFPKDSIMALDGGNTSWWGFHYHVIRSERSMIHSSNYGHLGTGLPYAIGAKLAHPDKIVYAINGDSAFNFNIQELETSLRENLPVINLVMVDGAYGMEKLAQRRSWGREAPWFGVYNAEEIRYDKICEAVGGHGEFVTKASEIAQALERSGKSGKVSVIHCVIDPDSNVWPPGIEAWNAMRSGKVAELFES